MSDKQENITSEQAMARIDSEAMTREEIEELLTEMSMDEFIDLEMQRLGFWDPNKPNESEKELQTLEEERTKLQKKFDDLQSEFAQISDIDARLEEDRVRRIESSRQRNRERRKQRQLDFIARKKKWEEQQKRDILYLGEDVSQHLSVHQTSTIKLEKNQLPVVGSVIELAELLEVDVPTLRKYSYHQKVSRYNTYVRFSIPKKTGGERIISAPRPELKKIQKLILEKILVHVPLHNAVHGFRKDHSIVTNARPHVGKAIVINMDLLNFFPTFTYNRIKGCFINLGYSPQISTILALLCTEAEVGEFRMPDGIWFVRKGQRYLPQGAPTSPALSNIICYSLDRRLAGLAKSYGWNYTRYADDLTFSHENADARIHKFLTKVTSIVQEEDLHIHPSKTKIMRRHHSQEVTGIVVNVKPTISRKERKRFKAFIHRLETQGPQNAYWNSSDDVLSAALGYVSHMKAIDPIRWTDLHTKVKKLCKKYR